MNPPESINRQSPLLVLAGIVLLAAGFVWFASFGLLNLGAASGESANVPCPESEFTCITIEAPVNHNEPSNGETIPVTFAVLPARSDPEGVILTAVGGPGSSGVAVADIYYPSFGPEIRDRFDIVYFDQRGVEIWDRISCPNAEWQNSEDYASLPADPAERWSGLFEITGEYVDACMSEMAQPEIVPHLDTSQAAADIEMFRQEMGYEKFVIYGESYGTQLAQVYATEYPESVERLILDGPLDLTRNGLDLNADQARALDDTLAVLFDFCDQDEWCSYDMGMPAARAYERLARDLAGGSTVVDFPVDKDSVEKIGLTQHDLGYLAYSSMYAENDRMLFLRALAAYSATGDLVPMLRLYGMGYASGTPPVLNAAVSCADTPYPGADIAEETSALNAARDTSDNSKQWFYEWPVTCLRWPGVDRTQDTPAPFTGEDIPTLVVASDGDVATPYSHALGVMENLADGHLLTAHGGTHVMFGRDIACIDDAVVAFALNGTAPVEEECDVEPVSPYMTLLPETWDGIDGGEMVSWAESEIYWFPELIGWDGAEPMTLGCNRGGEVTFATAGAGTAIELDSCGLGDGLVVTGAGEFDYDLGVSRLEVSVHGLQCTYDYEYAWDDSSETVDEVCP